jgi:hypothetical protein
MLSLLEKPAYSLFWCRKTAAQILRVHQRKIKPGATVHPAKE